MPRWSDEVQDDGMDEPDYIDLFEVLERIELREALEENDFYNEEDNDPTNHDRA